MLLERGQQRLAEFWNSSLLNFRLVIPGRGRKPANPESTSSKERLDSGFAAARRPGMTSIMDCRSLRARSV
jgi:hypothetical protein